MPANRRKTGSRNRRSGNNGSFKPGDPRINRTGRPKLAAEIQEALRDEKLARLWVRKIRAGLKVGDPEMMKLYGKHAVPTAGQLIEVRDADKLTDEELREQLVELGWQPPVNGEASHDA